MHDTRFRNFHGRLLLSGSLLLFALTTDACAQDLEAELSSLIKSAAAMDRSAYSKEKEADFFEMLEAIEEKIIYLQGIGSHRPIEFLAEELRRLQLQMMRLDQPREEMLRDNVEIVEELAQLGKELAKTTDAKRKLYLEGRIAELNDELVLSKLPKKPVTVYWLLVRGITGFGRDSAIAHLADVLKKNMSSQLAHDILFGLQGNRAPSLVDVHELVLKRGAPELAIMSAEQLAEIKIQPSIEVLVDAMKKHRASPAVSTAIGQALETLTGQPHGADAQLWRDWWKGAKAVGVKKTESGRFVKEGEEGQSVAEKRNPQVKVLVLTQHCAGHFEPYDRVEQVLGANGIAHDIMEKDVFSEKPPQDLDQYSAILVNCTQFRPHCHGKECTTGAKSGFRMHRCAGPGPHDTRAHRLSDSALQQIDRFVRKGGFLFTEDWGQIEIIHKLYSKFIAPWPGNIEDSSKFLKKQDVDVDPVPGSTSHHLLRGVYEFHEVGDEDIAEALGGTDASVRVGKLMHKWHIDNESPAMAIKDRKRVTVLLASNAVAGQTSTDGACAATFFPHGEDTRFMQDSMSEKRARHGGRVVHILSHFTKQENIEDDRAIKRLLLNFLEEAAWAWDARQRRKARK